MPEFLCEVHVNPTQSVPSRVLLLLWKRTFGD